MHYSEQNVQPLFSADWEKVETLKWPRLLKGMISKFLKKVRENGFIPERDEWVVNHRRYLAYDLSTDINLGFRKHKLPYRCFKAEYGGDTYTIGIVKPIRRRHKKIKDKSFAIKLAGAFIKRPNSKNIARLKDVLKNL